MTPLLLLSLLVPGRFHPLDAHLPRVSAIYLSERVVAVADTAGRFLGSGFLVGASQPGSARERKRSEKGDIFLVTNVHVLGGRERVLAFRDGIIYRTGLVLADSEADVAVLRLVLDSAMHRPATVPREDFVLDGASLWPGMMTVSAAYALGLGWVTPDNPSLSFARIAQIDRDDGIIRLEGVLDLGSSGAPVFTWIEKDRGSRLHLAGMARSFQVARCLSEGAGDTLVIHSGLFEIIPASTVNAVIVRADSILK
jgi:hypothetical protein